jgi:hypothetical protein
MQCTDHAPLLRSVVHHVNVLINTAVGHTELVGVVVNSSCSASSVALLRIAPQIQTRHRIASVEVILLHV